MHIAFKEAPVFTRQVCELLTDDEYKELQLLLIEDPSRGPVMKGTGGCREQENLTAEQRKVLQKLVRRELQGGS